MPGPEPLGEAAGVQPVQPTAPAQTAAQSPGGPQARPAGAGGSGQGGQGGTLRAATPGTYRVVLTVDGKEFTQVVQVQRDPNAPATLSAELEEELYLYDDASSEEYDARRRGKLDD